MKNHTSMKKKTDFKIHILYEFVEGPWGGGNQFLKNLRDYFRTSGIYTEKPEDADVILFNSHHSLNKLFSIKKKYPDKLVIHRVDGPISKVRGRDRIVDEKIIYFNNILADGTVFQSNWSKEQNYEISIQRSNYEATIINAPDPLIFNQKYKRIFSQNKVKLIATSWSSNMRKGFEIYKFLDENLDFEKYEMTFVGNSPVEFENIKCIEPLASSQLACILKEHDIFITASKSDPCSNSLIEALHCGLPAVARNDGGHPEIVGLAGELFESEETVIETIENVSRNYGYYQSKISLSDMEAVGKEYYHFARAIYDDYFNGIYTPKKLRYLDIMKTMEMRVKSRVLYSLKL